MISWCIAVSWCHQCSHTSIASQWENIPNGNFPKGKQLEHKCMPSSWPRDFAQVAADRTHVLQLLLHREAIWVCLLSSRLAKCNQLGAERTQMFQLEAEWMYQLDRLSDELTWLTVNQVHLVSCWGGTCFDPHPPMVPMARPTSWPRGTEPLLGKIWAGETHL